MTDLPTNSRMSPPASPRRARGIPQLALALAQLAAMACFARPWAQIDGFPLDDAWIHQVVARTFASTGTLGYAKGAFGAGATSYLWAGLLSVNFRIVHVDPVAYTLVVNGVLALLTGQLLFQILLEANLYSIAPAWAKALVAATFATTGGNVLWFTFSGMEANLVMALSLGAIVPITRPFPVNAKPRLAALLGSGVCLGLLALTRPEASGLALLLVAASFWRGDGRLSLRDVGTMLAPWGVCIALYVGFNRALTGTPFPSTLEGRRWLWLDGTAGTSPWRTRSDLFAGWLDRIRAFTLDDPPVAWFWLALAFAVIGLGVILASRSRGLLLLFAWGAAHLGIYALIMPAMGHGGRYQPLTPLLFYVALSLGACSLFEYLLRWVQGLRRRPFAAWVGLLPVVIGIFPWVVLTVTCIRTWSRDHALAVAHIQATEVALGPIVNQLPEGDAVASFDIGASGYFANRSLIDLGALTERRALPFLKDGRVWEYLRERDVQYVILPLGYSDEFPDVFNFGYRLHLFDNPAVVLEPVRELMSPPEIWGPGIGSTMHSAPRQGIFRLRFTGEDDAPTVSPLTGAPRITDFMNLLDVRARQQIARAMDVLAAAGVPVHVVLTDTREKLAAAPDVWGIEIGGWGAVLVPPSTYEAVSLDEANQLLTKWVKPYVELGDLGAGVRAALYAVMLVVRRFVDHAFFPMFPPLPVPAGADTHALGNTAIWGIPFALSLVFVAWFARRRALALEAS